jgi:hypothetical protein
MANQYTYDIKMKEGYQAPKSPPVMVPVKQLRNLSRKIFLQASAQFFLIVLRRQLILRYYFYGSCH